MNSNIIGMEIKEKVVAPFTGKKIGVQLGTTGDADAISLSLIDTFLILLISKSNNFLHNISVIVSYYISPSAFLYHY